MIDIISTDAEDNDDDDDDDNEYLGDWKPFCEIHESITYYKKKANLGVFSENIWPEQR